jgi:hypothetical protein
MGEWKKSAFIHVNPGQINKAKFCPQLASSVFAEAQKEFAFSLKMCYINKLNDFVKRLLEINKLLFAVKREG